MRNESEKNRLERRHACRNISCASLLRVSFYKTKAFERRAALERELADAERLDDKERQTELKRRQRQL